LPSNARNTPDKLQRTASWQPALSSAIALLNATFGNAAELLIAGIALSKGLTGVVKASITGNILLALGLSALSAG
jgi:Ca2+:H+ antiporter